MSIPSMMPYDRREIRKKRISQFLALTLCFIYLAATLKQPLVLSILLVVFVILSRKIMLDKKLKIPILCYHSISEDTGWLNCDNISISARLFEKQVNYLKQCGYHTVSLADIYRHLKYGSALPPLPVALTFDDGYLDNWVSVYPILKKYNLQGTLFISTGLVNPLEECRPNLEDVWSNRQHPREVDWRGYLTWKEIQTMEASGVIEVQSHTVSHTKRMRLVAEFTSIEERRRRVYRELTESKKTLEEKLNKKIDFLAWPGEEMDEMMFDIAVKEAGYLATTGFYGFNTLGDPPEALSRIFILNGFCGCDSDFWNLLNFKCHLHMAEGNLLYYLILCFNFLWMKFNPHYL